MTHTPILPGPLPDRRTFTLSESNPISVQFARHATLGDEPVCDMHYELEMGIVLKGHMRRYYGETAVERRKGEFWFCGMWEPHGFTIPQAPCDALVFVIWPPLLANAHFPEMPGMRWLAPFSGNPAGRPVSAPGASSEVIAQAKRMMDAMNRGGPAAGLRLRLLLFELLLMMTGPEPAGTGTGAAPATPDNYGSITPALTLAFESKRLVTNEEAARACTMSRDRFVRMFDDLMGISFSRFSLRRRLSRAAAMIVGSDEPIKAVAREWGFTDAPHLHRLFVANYGLSPRQYRQRLSPDANES